MLKTEVAIIGGGPAGAACAIALSRAGMNCAVFERAPRGSWKAGEVIDSKVCGTLQELGLWDKFSAMDHLRSAGSGSLWGNETVETSSAIDPFGGGFFIDRASFEDMLLEEAEKAGAKVFRGAAVRSAKRNGLKWSILGVAPENIALKASLLIEATGRGRSLAAPGDRWQLDSLTALIAYAGDSDKEPDLRFCVEATEAGWWYAAPLPGQKKAVAFLTDADLLPRGKAARDGYFKKQFEKTRLIRDRFRIPVPTGIRTVSAASSIRRILTGDRWVCLGEAASSYDPLTGTGIYAALTKGAALARVILQEPAMDSAFSKYAEAERAAFEDYILERHAIYRNEGSWPGSLFWQRRAAFRAMYSAAG